MIITIVCSSLFTFLFFWCHFVYLECFCTKEKSNKKETKKPYRVNANYAIVPFYTYWYDSMLVWNGAEPIMLTCFQKVDGIEWEVQN